MTEVFPSFPRIARLYREIVVTEKMDGTNGLVHVSAEGIVRAGSRNRWITPEADNYDFARWVKQNEDQLRLLGEGFHYGEWWGIGIARRYNISERRWSLFNTSKWNTENPPPACCSVVPVLGCVSDFGEVAGIARALAATGSVAAPGFTSPEGVVVFHVPGQTYFKFTLDGDGHKG